MKTGIIVISILCIINYTSAQSKALIAEGASPRLYITHTIEPKENFYSIGRMYNVSPKELAPFNNLDIDKGLNLGQAIKIPLNQNNFVQEKSVKNTEMLIPLYHIIEAKEGLYHVSTNYNKVPLAELKKWNALSSDVVSAGTKLIIGYLKVQKDQSPLAKANDNTVTKVAMNAGDDKPQAKSKSDPPKEIVSPEKTPEPVKTSVPEIKDKPVVKDQPATTNNVFAAKTNINFNGGSFKNLYDQQHHNTPVTQSGISGVFKSTSGWRDGKYYCFNNEAQSGTILKITNTANDKTIYAKVLDLIPDINKNDGLILHISNAAAEELGVNDSRFDCTIIYSK